MARPARPRAISAGSRSRTRTAAGTRKPEGPPSTLVRRLESELRATRKAQQRLIGQLERSNDQLMAANQQLIISTEELETMNEELTALNGQLQDKVRELTVVNDDLANLLVSTDIATVFLDTQLRIKRFTTAASHVLELRPADTGRPLHKIASSLVDVNLAHEARAVLARGTAIDKAVAARDGREYSLRGLPYRTRDQHVGGVVLTLVDVTTLAHTERELRAAREQMAEDLRRMSRLHEVSVRLTGSGDVRELQEEILRAAVAITGAEMGFMQQCDPAGVLTVAASVGFAPPFLDFFARVDAHTDCACGAAMGKRQRVIAEDIAASPIFAGAAALDVMLTAGVRAVQSTPLFDLSGRFLGMLSTYYGAVHHFDDAELRWLDLLARHAADVFTRQEATELLSNAREELEQRVADRTKWLTLMHDVTRAINDAARWDDALQLVLRRICELEHWQLGYVYLPDRDNADVIVPVVSYCSDERYQPFHAESEWRRHARGENLPGRVYAEGAPLWLNLPEELLALLPLRAQVAKQAGLKAAAALPIRFGRDVIAVLELFSDQPHAPNEVLADLMNDVTVQIGKVLERERSTAQMADLVWREQQGLLHMLHDSLGQTLTGLGMLSTALRQQLAATNAAAADTARQLAEQAQVALEQVRQLSSGLFPLDIDPAGLLPALRKLATTTETFHKLRVHVERRGRGAIRDSRIATELYRIGQEAVTNAVKHAEARTIRIELSAGADATRLRVTDDGIGIEQKASKGDGLGLRIMRYRATSIGALLSIDPAAGGGTAVTCTLREAPRPQGRADDAI